MPDFSEFADDAKKLAGEHPEQADQAFDKAADFANQETGNRFGSEVQRGEQAGENYLGVQDQDQQGQQQSGQQQDQGQGGYGQGQGGDQNQGGYDQRPGPGRPVRPDQGGDQYGRPGPGQSPGPGRQTSTRGLRSTRARAAASTGDSLLGVLRRQAPDGPCWRATRSPECVPA